MGTWPGLSGLHAEIAYRIPVSFGLRDISASWYIGVPGSNADRGGFDGGAPHRPRLAESANESATDEQGGIHSEGWDAWRSGGNGRSALCGYVSELCSEKHSG